MISGFKDTIDTMQIPNYFDGEHDHFNLSKSDHFQPEYVFKAFSYEFFDGKFDVSIGEEKLTDSRFLKVDIKKIETYVVPLAIMETVHANGTVTRMMSQFKNCNRKLKNTGRLCPDWYENGMYD